ncbi:MAG: molecular chaperone HtpG [Clostridia bacterium]|jgi:molecular chaperone HtpG|nr:molecular chaperone HtpG [Clostridia bacterium]
MGKRKFKTESKRLLDLMINSIYTHKEIFLRELVSNASDAIDKIYYKALTDEKLSFNQEDYYISIEADKESRTLVVRDTGIGMSEKELEDNLGVIAKSGSLDFKDDIEKKDGFDIIGQFGVGFYSAFMVADIVSVKSKALGSDQAFEWKSKGADGYTIEPCELADVGTVITLHVKDNTDDENYDDYLDSYRLQSIVKKYSDFIRYPIKMEVTKTRQAEEGEETESYTEQETINSMVPIWSKNKSELTGEDYENFYNEKRYGFDKPAKHIHIKAEGTVRYNAILYIPQSMPFDFYSKEYERGLELYSSGVMIMKKCQDLIPEYFGFVQGMVDSEDLSLNISRELLQHDRQLKTIAKNIKTKIKNELKSMLEKDREGYEKFFETFGRQLKYGVYSEYGMNKDDLQDLLLFYSSTEKKVVTLAEYIDRMGEDQKYIYYAAGESNERIASLPQTEMVADKGYEILYFTDDVDEFAIRVLQAYDEKEFKSVSGSDLGFEADEKDEAADKDNEALFTAMKESLGDKVTKVRASKRLKNHPVCLATDGELSIEMEKVLAAMPDNPGMKADKVLEINTNHEIFAVLKSAEIEDKDKLSLYTQLLYNQALLIEGLSVADPVAFTDDILKLMK